MKAVSGKLQVLGTVRFECGTCAGENSQAQAYSVIHVDTRMPREEDSVSKRFEIPECPNCKMEMGHVVVAWHRQLVEE